MSLTITTNEFQIGVHLTADEEEKLLENGLNRVTDTCIPEDEAMRKIEALLNKEWQKADQNGESHPPHYYFWQFLKNPEFKNEYQIDPKDSWMIAAMEKNLPIYTPGWEDSTNGNMYTAAVIEGRIKNVHTMNSGIQTMMRLSRVVHRNFCKFINWIFPNWWWNCR